MLTKDEAKQIVDARINEEDPYAVKKVALAIIDDETIEKEYGWVFFYETKEYLKTGDLLDTLVVRSLANLITRSGFIRSPDLTNTKTLIVSA